MSRVQIELPERFAYSVDLPLYGMHINMGGHLDNAMLIAIVSEALHRYFEFLGYSHLDPHGIEGHAVITADLAVQYESEASYGETMRIDMTPGAYSRCGFDMLFRVRDQGSGRAVSRGKLGLVFFDLAAKKAVPVPEEFKRKASLAV